MLGMARQINFDLFQCNTQQNIELMLPNVGLIRHVSNAYEADFVRGFYDAVVAHVLQSEDCGFESHCA